MPSANRKLILLWTIVLTGLGASALWASSQPGWVQDRLFGPANIMRHDAWERSLSPKEERYVLSMVDQDRAPTLRRSLQAWALRRDVQLRLA